MKFLLARLKEPSTAAGLALLFQLPKAIWPLYSVIFDGVTAGFAGLAIFLREGGS